MYKWFLAQMIFAFPDQNQWKTVLKRWTLWIVDDHANVKGIWIRLIDGDIDFFFIHIFQ